MARVFKYTMYKVKRSEAPFGFEVVTVITDEGQRAKAPENGAERFSSFYGQTNYSRDEMIKHGYIVQSKIA